MASFNPNIIAQLGQNQVQLQDPIERYAKGLQLKQLMQGVQQQDAALAEDKAVREAYKASGGDFDRLRVLLQSGGNYRPLQALEKNRLDTDKTRSDIDKDRIETTTKAVAQHRDALSMVNNPQDAAMWVASAYKDPYISPIFSRIGDVNTLVSRIPTDPEQFQQWKQQQALGATKFIEANKPQIVTSNLGATTKTQAIEPLSGNVRTLQESKNTVSPNTAAQLQVETDPALQGKLAGAKAKGQQAAKLEAEAEFDAPNVIAKGQDAIRLVDDLLSAPGFKQSVGTSRLLGIQNVPGSSAKDFDIRLEQLKGQQFLQAFESLKGGGQITEVEGKKATDAISRMNASSSEKEFVKAAKEFQDIIRRGVQRAQQRISTSSQEPKTEFTSLPDPAQYKGKRIQGPNGIMRSNGKSWVME